MTSRFFIGLLLLAIAVTLGCDNPGASHVADAKPTKKFGPAWGVEAPEIVGKDLDGVEFKLSDYRGKVVMLDFYGDW